jgi:hypothetical protein
MTLPNHRPRKIKSPRHLQELFDEYKAWASVNPWKKQDFIRSGESAGQIIELEIDRPLTEYEFAAYLGFSRQGLRNYGEAKGYENFFETYAKIQTEMTSQRVSGGLVNAYNANLVARIDGLVDKTAVEHSGDVGLAESLQASRQRKNEPTEDEAKSV